MSLFLGTFQLAATVKTFVLAPIYATKPSILTEVAIIYYNGVAKAFTRQRACCVHQRILNLQA